MAYTIRMAWKMRRRRKVDVMGVTRRFLRCILRWWEDAGESWAKELRERILCTFGYQFKGKTDCALKVVPRIHIKQQYQVRRERRHKSKDIVNYLQANTGLAHESGLGIKGCCATLTEYTQKQEHIQDIMFLVHAYSAETDALWVSASRLAHRHQMFEKIDQWKWFLIYRTQFFRARTTPTSEGL